MYDLHRLHILRVVAQHGSFSKAAGALHVTPSAVSQHIAALERSAGLPLVERSPRGVRLTEPGRVLAATADAVAVELDSARQELSRLAQGEVRHLTVVTFPSGGQRLLPPALSRFTRAHPDVEITVMEAEPHESVPLMRAGNADIALVYQPTPVERDERALTWRLLLTDPMYLVLPADHPLAGASKLAVSDLAGERWILANCTTGEQMLHQASLVGFNPRIACRSSDYLFMHAMVNSGVGVALIPRLGLPDPIGSQVAVIPIVGEQPGRYVYAVTPRARWTNPLAAALINQLAAHTPTTP
jgi:DNA-binding transcriptional LysR family regulator